MNEQAAQQRRAGRRGNLLLCLLLSLLLHVGLAWMLDILPRSNAGQTGRHAMHAVRHVQVVRAEPKQEKPASEPQRPQEPEAPFVKTQVDNEHRRPEQADFISNHDSIASGEDDAPQHQSDEPLPTIAGRENEDELVTFDQERQDGELEHEGKLEQDAQPVPRMPMAETDTPQPHQPIAQGRPDGSTQNAHPQGEGNTPPQPASESTASLPSSPPEADDALKLDELHMDEALTLKLRVTSPAPFGQTDGAEGHSAERPRQTAYDPSLASHVRQPGLRTYERRTRSTGRFVFGRRPALNVAATARGRYEAEIYRRIARVWYAACDEHRGDIIPGSITVSLRLTRRGSIDSMNLVRRRGASLIQQSFSFGAIRHAALPPMPPEVQQGIIGELYEMILTFNFD